MTLQASLYTILTLQAGESLGYNSTFQATRETRVGLVCCGYAHGYPRSLPQSCDAMIAGRKARLIGRVSMDTLTIDLSEPTDVGPEADVPLWGVPGLPLETGRAAGRASRS